MLGERLRENMPAQEILGIVREEILATTKLPMAIDFMLAELRHLGAFSARPWSGCTHYFTPFQCFVMQEAENDTAAVRPARRARNPRPRGRVPRRGRRRGRACSSTSSKCSAATGWATTRGWRPSPATRRIDETWRNWILTVRRQIGMVDLADLIFVHSEFYHERKPQRRAGRPRPSADAPHGRGARPRAFRRCSASRKAASPGPIGGKDPLLLFAALHRQLGYPEAPRAAAGGPRGAACCRRWLAGSNSSKRRLKLVEEEQRGGINLEQFYAEKQNRSGAPAESP